MSKFEIFTYRIFSKYFDHCLKWFTLICCVFIFLRLYHIKEVASGHDEIIHQNVIRNFEMQRLVDENRQLIINNKALIDELNKK